MILSAIMAFGSWTAAAAPDDDPKTAAIKVAFIYNFAKFTVWPPGRLGDPGAPLRFCVQAQDLNAGAIQSLEGKHIGSHPVRVEDIARDAAIDGCHVMFASGFASDARLHAVIGAAMRSGILLVSDMPGFAFQGGHIGLTRDRNRIGFQVNLKSILQSRLKLSSKVLQLAEIVGPTRE